MNEARALSRVEVVRSRGDEMVADGPSGNGLAPLSGRYADERGDAQGVNLVEYLRIARKHFWLMLGITVIIPTLVGIYVARQPDIYEAQARIQVDLENSNPLLGGGMSKGSSVILNSESNDPAYFNTQLQILNGAALLRRVVKSLDLEHNPSFRPERSSQSTVWSGILRAVGLQKADPVPPATPPIPIISSAPSTTENLEEAERLVDYVEQLENTLRVEPVKETRLTVRETRLIDISYRHTDARLAARIVNAVADTFVNQNIERKNETSSSTGVYLEKRIAELQSNIRTKEAELIDYGKSHQILSLDTNQNTVVDRLSGLNKQLLIAENERKLAEAAYKASLEPGAAIALSEGGVTDPSATKLTSAAELKIVELKQKRSELLVENTEKWPAVREVDKQIADLQRQVNESRARAAGVVTTNLATRYRQAQANEDALRKAYDQQRVETLTQNEAAVSYRIIQQEIETYNGLLEGLLQRTKENDVVMAGTPNNIRVVDHAIPQKKAVAPRRMLVIGLSILLSLGCAIGLAFLIEYLDDSVRTTEDVENFIHLPAVAVIPQVGKPKSKRIGAGSKTSLVPANRNGGLQEIFLTSLDNRSSIAEAYRHLRTSVLLSTAGRPPKTLLITSSLPSEGKTTTAVNTAMSLAQTGAKVLIIDADMRRPRLHGIFNLKNQVGLSSLLSSDASESEVAAAIQYDETSGLFVLPAGSLPPNPAELVGSEQMLKLINRVTPNFAHVIIDSPPIAAFTDGVLIGAMVDGVLLVVQSGRISRKVINRARKLLQDVGARIIGVVLNQVEAGGSTSYYYYHGYYQHYGSADESESDDRRAGATA